MSAVVLAAAGLAAAALVTLGVSGLVTVDDVAPTSGRSSDRGLAAVPAAPAPAPGLEGRPPAVAFERPGPDLSPGTLGPWEEAAGDWEAAGGEARVVAAGREGALAVVAPPAGTSVVQVTVAGPRPGAGVVASYAGPDDHLALVVDASGRRVVLQRVAGDPAHPVVLGQALLEEPGGPLVLAVRRDGNRVRAVANGVVVVDRVDRARAGADRVGLVAGPGASGRAARFDDLVVA